MALQIKGQTMRHLTQTSKPMAGRWMAVALLCLPFVLGGGPAEAKTAYESGLRRAHRHGLNAEKSACYAQVFARYAVLNRYGHYAAPRKYPFRLDLWNQCQVAR